MKKPFVFVAMLTLALGLMLVSAPQALACPGVNEWSVEVTPRTVEEGGSVRITVRNEQATDSGVAVETLDESAKTGKDYTGIPKQTVYVYGFGTFKFTVPISNDTTTEPAETFKLRLSDPKQRNCYYGVNGPGRESAPDSSDTGTYILPEPVTVTIATNDAASSPPATSPALKNSSAPGQSVVSSASSPLQSVSSAPFPTPSSGVAAAEKTRENLPGAHGNESPQSPGPRIQAQRKSGGGHKLATIVAISILASASAGFGLWKWRRT